MSVIVSSSRVRHVGRALPAQPYWFARLFTRVFRAFDEALREDRT